MGPAYKVFFKPTSALYSNKPITRGVCLADTASMSLAGPLASFKRPEAGALACWSVRMRKGIRASLLLLLAMTGFGGATAQSTSYQPKASGMEDVVKIKAA